MPLVTVIIPTYNHGPFVAETLASVFIQTLGDQEIIVINDGSPDETATVLRPYAERGQIVYVEQENRGQAAARNRGLAMARGEFVAFLDDDDLWPADKLEWQVAALRSSNVHDLVAGTVTRDLDGGADGGLKGMIPNSERQISYDELFWGCPFVSPGQTLMRTAAVREAGGFDECIRGVDDFDLYLRMARRRPLLSVARPALRYRVHAGNASKDRRGMLRAGAACLRKRLAEVPLRRRWRMSRRSYRGLYDFVGRDALRSATTGGVAEVAGVVGSLWPGLASDPRLAWWLVRDAACFAQDRRR